ncbi:phage antirepressor [Yersinia frederiksenii]|nr:phage antirepressor [Yersinia frederiksenii]
MKNTNTIIPFAFENHKVRSILRDGSPWFVAQDICAALSIQNVTQSIERLDDDERSMFNIGRQGAVNIINESGMYTLVLRCRDAIKPGTLPHRFRKWVTNEVLPQIRKTGQYKSTPQFDDNDIPFPSLEPQPMPGRYLVTIGAGGKKEVVNIDNRNAVDADAMAQLTRDAYYLELLIKDFRERLAVVRGDVDISIFKTPLKDLYR